MADISQQIILIIVVYACLAGAIIVLILFRTNRRIQLRQYPTPHTPIAEDSNQAMRDEILAGLDKVSHIKVQPRFLAVEGQGEGESPDSDLSHRMISVDSMRSLDRMVVEILPTWAKTKNQSVREFLFILSRPDAPLGQVSDVVLALLDSYERARYGSLPYNENERKVFIDTLMDLINRLSILDPENFADGPETTVIDEDELMKWLSTPGQVPEFSTLARSSSTVLNPRSDPNTNQTRELNQTLDISFNQLRDLDVHQSRDVNQTQDVNRSRDLIDFSGLSEGGGITAEDTDAVDRPASLEIS